MLIFKLQEANKTTAAITNLKIKEERGYWPKILWLSVYQIFFGLLLLNTELIQRKIYHMLTYRE